MKAKIMKVPDVGQVVTSTFHINIQVSNKYIPDRNFFFFQNKQKFKTTKWTALGLFFVLGWVCWMGKLKSFETYE